MNDNTTTYQLVPRFPEAPGQLLVDSPVLLLPLAPLSMSLVLVRSEAKLVDQEKAQLQDLELLALSVHQSPALALLVVKRMVLRLHDVLGPAFACSK